MSANKICVCKGIEYSKLTPQEIVDKFLLFETNKKFDIGIPFRHKDKTYYPGCIMSQENIIIVHEFELNKDVTEEIGESNIKCPYCGKEDGDSWEAGESNDEEVCEHCGSTFSWERQVSVTYDSQPVKIGEIIDM